MPSDFWDRKRQERNPQEPVRPSAMEVGPWWRTGLHPGQLEAQRPAQGQLELDLPGIIDGHDVSKAGILKGDAEECPRCPRDPRTGIAGNMYRPAKTAAIRCFDCGYIEGRDLGEGQLRAAVVEGKAQRARQTDSGGAVVHNYMGGKMIAGRL